MSDLARRLLSAAVLVPAVVLLILFSNSLLFSLVICVFSFFCAFEYLTISLGRQFGKRRFAGALLSSALALSIAFFRSYPWAVLMTLTLVLPVSSLMFMFLFGDIKQAVLGVVHTVFGAVYTGCLWGFVALTFSYHDDGRYWIFALVAGSSLGDTGAYGLGRLFGRKKLAPRISPGKTVAGSFGGILGSLLGIVLAKLLFFPQVGIIEMIILGIALSLACQTGDLIESFLKRGFDAKDSSKLIPGHGGVLDRCDSLMLGAPVVFLYSIMRDTPFFDS